MASLSNDANGTRRLLFTRPVDGKRVAIRLGKIPAKDARTIIANVEALVVCAIAGTSMTDEVARWVGSVGDRLHASLAEHGLVSARRRVQLGEFLGGYRTRRTDVKNGTSTGYRTSAKRLLAFFDAGLYLHEVTQGDADAWLIYLRSQNYAPATIGRTVKHARQFFRDAIRSSIITHNPFADIKAPPQTNRDRLHFVTVETIQRVINAAPDGEWRLLIALSRFGGLRCPSEHLALKWTDVNWDTQRIRIDSPKTGERFIPIFPELHTHLQAAFEAAAPGSVNVITRASDASVNLRTQFQRIIRRAGVASWPRLFHNLRASRQTELEDTFPGHVVCAWLGNSERVAAKHYLKPTDNHYDQAVSPKVTRNCAQTVTESNGIQGTFAMAEMQKTSISMLEIEVNENLHMTPTGSEPNSVTTNSVSELRPNQKTAVAQSCADWFKRDARADADASLLRLHVKAFMQGDIE